jgi:hypothetical protein
MRWRPERVDMSLKGREYMENGLWLDIYYRLVGPWIGFKTVTVSPRCRCPDKDGGWHYLAIPTGLP